MWGLHVATVIYASITPGSLCTDRSNMIIKVVMQKKKKKAENINKNSCPNYRKFQISEVRISKVSLCVYVYMYVWMNEINIFIWPVRYRCHLMNRQ
jgi:hypothetical protein